MTVAAIVKERGAPPKKRSKVAKKKAELEQDAPIAGPSRPRLFAPFRALGLVTNHVPFAMQTRSFKGATEGPRIHIVTSIGRSWMMWEGGKMTLLFVGPECPQPVTFLAFDRDYVLACTGSHVVRYSRGKEVDRLANPLGTNLAFVTTFGDITLSLTEDGTRMLVWNSESRELQNSVEFDNGFTATTILHPATYLNKVLVSSSEGSLQLWNIRSSVCIHKFDSTNLRDAATANSSSITALVQSPAIDVVGIGFSSGEISIYDVRADERLMRIFMEGGGIRSLAFRTDGESVLASASSTGHIALWDLNNGGRLLHIIRGAHDRAVTSIEWVPGQPLLISSGEDNSVKQWFFESPTAPPRLLKFRSGHHEPPSIIRYYGDDGKQLLTASGDRSLRYTSVVRDSRSFELSQGHIAKKATSLSVPTTSLKFPPVISLSYSSARSKDWDDVLTAHKQEVVARTWSVKDKKLGKWTLNLDEPSPEKGKKKKTDVVGSAQAVCVSACGNFGLASSSSGVIRMWNMQSGMKRKDFKVGACPPEVAARMRSTEKARSVNGLVTDALNRELIASTYDGTINFFDFHTTALLHTVVLPSTCSAISLQRESGLLAVICDDLVVRLVDIESRRIVREMMGFGGNVLDVAFSPDSRWLIASSLDSTIRTFDIPSGRLIDSFRTPSVATSITFSPSNDFLATAHVDSRGIYLWANRAQYTDVSLQGISEKDVAEVALPTVQDEVEEDGIEALQSLSIEDKPEDVFATPTQLGGDLITLTLLPRSRWQTLLNLDVIQQRNKPKEAPKAPEKAPFFLPTLPGVEHRFAITQKDAQDAQKKDTSKKLEAGATQAESAFYKKLVSEDPESDFESLFSYIKTLTPAAIDLEVRALVSLEGLATFLNALLRRLKSHRDFELVQTLISVLLRIHGDVLLENEELTEPLQKLRESQVEESGRLLDVISASMGTLGFIRDVL